MHMAAIESIDGVTAKHWLTPSCLFSLSLEYHAASASLLQPQWSALQRDQPNDFSRHLKRLSPLWRPAERHEVDWEGGATARCLSYRNGSKG